MFFEYSPVKASERMSYSPTCRCLESRLTEIVAMVFLSVIVARGETNGFLSQFIALPANVSASCFADINHDNRSDLIAVDPVEKKVLVYHQRASGFTNAPDQIIDLAAQTSW